jgi:hypothetical protein
MVRLEPPNWDACCGDENLTQTSKTWMDSKIRLILRPTENRMVYIKKRTSGQFFFAT